MSKRITSAVGFEVPGEDHEADAITGVVQGVADLFAQSSLNEIEFAHALGFALTIHYKVNRRQAANAHELKTFLTALIDDTWDRIDLPMLMPDVSERQQ